MRRRGSYCILRGSSFTFFSSWLLFRSAFLYQETDSFFLSFLLIFFMLPHYCCDKEAIHSQVKYTHNPVRAPTVTAALFCMSQKRTELCFAWKRCIDIPTFLSVVGRPRAKWTQNWGRRRGEFWCVVHNFRAIWAIFGSMKGELHPVSMSTLQWRAVKASDVTR